MNQFTDRYEELGFKFEEVILKPCIRVNTLKISKKELKERLEDKGVKVKDVSFLENGLYTKSRFSMGSTPEYLQGLYYIQEASSQIPVEILKPSGVVLDCCSAPGGKTTQIAETAKVVIALELNYNRTKVLLNNIERLGVSNCIVYNVDVRRFEGQVDKVLVDAPCSGNYVTDPRWFEKQSLNNFKKNAELQKEILGYAFDSLKKGGELVYSTCSLEPEENEMVVSWFLEKFDVKILPIKTIGVPGLTKPFGRKLNEDVKHARRVWPTQQNTQGFFIAKFKKK